MQGVAVLLVMKVAYQEERKPSSWVEARTMGKHEGRCKFIAILAWDHIHHSGGVLYCVIPESLWHLFFSEISPGHVHHNFPMGFDQPI
jgi:hypothetical protein